MKSSGHDINGPVIGSGAVLERQSEAYSELYFGLTNLRVTPDYLNSNTIIVICTAIPPLWCAGFNEMNEAWYHVLIKGQLQLLRLHMIDIKFGLIRIIEAGE